MSTVDYYKVKRSTVVALYNQPNIAKRIDHKWGSAK
jgi:hypothetical protein